MYISHLDLEHHYYHSNSNPIAKGVCYNLSNYFAFFCWINSRFGILDSFLFCNSAIVNNSFLPLCFFFHKINSPKWDYWSKDISVFIDFEAICQSTFQKACSNFHIVSSMLCSIIPHWCEHVVFSI